LQSRKRDAALPGGRALSKRDLAASVRQRLLNQAHAQGRPFQELLQYYAIERFLYRLAQSSHGDKFILKGALLLTVWQAPLSRSTVDIDLLGKTSNKLEHIASLVSEICGLDVEADGVKFDPASIKTARIKEDADYEGIRVRFRAILAGARIPMQIDIGFGGAAGIPEGDGNRGETGGTHCARDLEQPNEGLLRSMGALPCLPIRRPCLGQSDQDDL